MHPLAHTEHKRQQFDVNLLMFVCLTNEAFVLCSNVCMLYLKLDVLNRQQIKMMLCGHLASTGKQEATVCSKHSHLKQRLTVLDLLKPLYLKEKKGCLL